MIHAGSRRDSPQSSSSPEPFLTKARAGGPLFARLSTNSGREALSAPRAELERTIPNQAGWKSGDYNLS
jgi:hypothetical protein